ncbi:hypothetical protein DFH06DRAFT_1169796 [Mycena polygramma]|nr:hypothetical protein DFH06DRAFT_1169796 [Mycena polygramma]
MADTVASQSTTWDWMRSIRKAESLQQMNGSLNSLAVIATFLAGVQAQAISFTLDNNETPLQTTTNTLFFAGLFIDVLSGTIAIVGAVQLQRTYGRLQQRETSLTALQDVSKNMPQAPELDNVVLAHHLRFLGMVIFPLLHTPRLWDALSEPLKQSANLVEQIFRESDRDHADRITLAYALADYRHTTNRLANSAFRTTLGFAASLTVPWLILAGLCSFASGAAILAFESQPIATFKPNGLALKMLLKT